MTESGQVTLLRFDQRQRWQQGQPVRVEAYLEKHPELRGNADAILDLIYNEIVLSEEMGASPRLDDYLVRFPQFATQLRLQFEVHQAIEEDSLASAISIRPGSIGAAPPDTPGTSLPGGATLSGYEILEELGRGGMGVVYKARQVDLKRVVALKMILAGAHAGPRERARFGVEAEAAARLQHPNIVQIYDIGTQDGVLYLCLEFVDGPTLGMMANGQPVPPVQAATLIRKLALAMGYAHQQGVIHRDLKPANILLASGGGELASGGCQPPILMASTGGLHPPLADWIPKITDFGLAKMLDGDGTQTPSAAFIGTPSYMAPEQSGDRSGPIGPASDVYALGAILYELLTGRPPFQAATLVETLDQVRNQEPIPPSRLQAGLPAELVTICLKCLEKEPVKRYASAHHLAEDLGHFLEGRPIAARPVHPGERLRKWARRRPAVAALVAVIVAAVLSLVGFFLWHQMDARARDILTRQQELANRQQALDTYHRFLQFQEDALFHGIYGTLFPDADLAANLQAARTAAHQALALVNTSAETVTLPRPDPYWTEGQRDRVSAGCFQLMLILAEAAAAPLPDQAPDERRRQVRGALTLLDRAAKLSPAACSVHLRRARYLDQVEEPARAQEEREAAASIQPNSSLDHFLLGQEHFLQGKVLDAIRSLESALRLQPDDFWSNFYLACCFLKNGSVEAAEARLETCKTLRPGFIWTWLLAGMLHGRRANDPAAEADYATALALGPNEDAAYSLYVARGRLRQRQKHFTEAVADVKKAMALKPKHHVAYLVLAQLYRERNLLPSSNQQLAIALRLPLTEAAKVECLAEQARNLFIEHRYQEAVTTCDVVLRMQPGFLDCNLLRARSLVGAGQWEEALRAFGNYLNKGGQPNAGFYGGRGEARMKLLDYPGATEDFSQALTLTQTLQPRSNSDLSELYLYRGWAYFFSNAWKHAQRDFAEAIRLGPASAEPYAGRGLAHVMQGHYREAVTDGREALDRRPAGPETWHNIACLFAQAAAKAEKDTQEPERHVLAAQYRAQAIAAVRSTLAGIPADKRQAFWREKIVPDAALDPVRTGDDFKRLEKELIPAGPFP